MYMKALHISKLPTVSRNQMVRIDELMIGKYGISLLQMMENAGRNMAELTRYILGDTVTSKKIVVFCGGGNNGGGGMVAARHLANSGAEITVALAVDESRLKKMPAHQLRALQMMDVRITLDYPTGKFDLAIDALIGYGLTGPPRGVIADWIGKLNTISSPVLSLDIPSGLEADSGEPPGACIRASATLTLALPKVGMVNGDVEKYIGELYLGDISVPVRLLREIGIITQPLFSNTSIFRIEK